MSGLRWHNTCTALSTAGKNIRRDGVATGQECPLQHHHAGRPQGGRAIEGQEGAHHAARAAVQGFRLSGVDGGVGGAGCLVGSRCAGVSEGWSAFEGGAGAGSLACRYRAECVAMEAGLKRLVVVIGLSKTRGTRAVAFTGSLLLLMALSAGPEVVEGAMLKRIWDIILRIFAASHVRQLSVHVLALRGATQRRGRQGS
ncbi:hypothetical protein ERJ75_000851400 [Trypanosoma vivax]|nr:hypothetical protein ERJ75_000851400 [Trypanosoma vivax]